MKHNLSGFFTAMDIATAAFDRGLNYGGYLVVPYVFPRHELWDEEDVYRCDVVGELAFGPADFSLAELVDATESMGISTMVRFPHTSQRMYLTRVPETFDQTSYAVWRGSDRIQIVATPHPLGECPSCPSSNVRAVPEHEADDTAWDRADAINAPWALEAPHLYECQGCSCQWHYVDLRYA